MLPPSFCIGEGFSCGTGGPQNCCSDLSCVKLLQDRMVKHVKSLVVGRGLTSIVFLSFASALMDVDHTAAAIV